jgi:hypothetical protein
MNRLLVTLFALTAFAAVGRAADEPAKGLSAPTRTGHFEKNTSGLKGETSFLVLRDIDSFEKVFGTVPPLGGKKANPVTKELFEKGVVVAVITRAAAVTTYSDPTILIDTENSTVKLSYKSVTGPPGTATFASPLIVMVPKEKMNGAVFFDNGKEVGSAK